MKKSEFLRILFGAILASSVYSASGWSAETRSAAELAQNQGVQGLPLDELERRVAQGDLSAQAELGARYGRGDGVPQNVPKALELIRAAAEKNNPDAAYYLGLSYASGTGVPQNEAQAMLFFETSANQGFPAAQYMMGSMISQGRGGIDANWEAALTFFWRAADSGYPPAEFMLGYAHQQGMGTARNPKIAAYWYRRTIGRSKHAGAEQNLRILIQNGEVEWQEGDPIPLPDLDETVGNK